ncbi:MAG: universal stress protein [Mycobacterium leprae]
MFKHLLVPLDGSRLAEAALPLTRDLATRTGAAVTLFHVLEKNAPDQIHGEPHLTDPATADAYMTRIASDLRASGLTVDWHVHDVAVPDVAESITRHAVELGIDLIVLSTHGQGGVRDLVFGTIAQQVIGHGDTPVFLIHPESAPDHFPAKRYLVPLDGKAEHGSSIPLAEGLAKRLGAQIHYLTVVPRRSDLGGTTGATARLLPTAMTALLDHREVEAGAFLERLAEKTKAAGTPATTQVERGEPATVILQALKEAGSDLLVLSTHTRKGWAAFWQGSVAPRIIAQWPHPTLLVRAKA